MHLLSDLEDGKDNKDIDELGTINIHSKVQYIDKFEMCSNFIYLLEYNFCCLLLKFHNEATYYCNKHITFDWFYNVNEINYLLTKFYNRTL